MITFSPVYLKEVDSTNTRCKQLAREGAPHGTAVIAEYQTAGRGRLGRRFCSPKGAGLYCTVLLREGFDMENIGLMTPCAAVAAAKAIENLAGIPAGIKWVNDIFLGGRKVCGILTEASLPDFAVIGIGINLLSAKEEFPEELHSIATSIQEETGRIITPREMEKELLQRLSEELETMGSRGFLEEYRNRSVLIGKEVDVHTGNSVYPARVMRIDDNAELVVALQNGEERVLNTGEVSIRNIKG